MRIWQFLKENSAQITLISWTYLFLEIINDVWNYLFLCEVLIIVESIEGRWGGIAPQERANFWSEKAKGGVTIGTISNFHNFRLQKA
jgi:hypothetical protein